MRTAFHSFFLVFIILCFALSVKADSTAPDISMTVRQIAHSVGLKGSELAQRLGLPGDINKDTSLSELGITPRQLEIALKGVPHPETAAIEAKTAVNTEMTLQEAAHALGTTGKELAHSLGLPVDVDKQVPLRDVGVTEEKLMEAAKHMGEEGSDLGWLKYPFWIAVCIFAVFILVKGRASKAVYLFTLAISLILTGFYLGKPPNPMESVVKLFKTAVGIYPDVMVKTGGFLLFCLLAVIGNKVICGWGCPFGALQELLYEIPLGKGVKRMRARKLPFLLTNTLRILLFAAFVVIIFGVVGNQRGLVLYHYINPFNLFANDFTLVSVVASITLFVLLSPFLYRSFCQFICPFGLISWLLEKISLARVQVNRNICTECMACVESCPLQAMEGRMARKAWPADCFSCGRCLRACNFNALDYRPVWEKAVKGEP